MLRLLLPLVLALVGAGAGIGAGLYLRPPPEAPAEDAHASVSPCGDPADPDALPAAASSADAGHGAEAGDDHEDGVAGTEFVKLNNQFVVPVMDGGKIVSLVVLSLSLETKTGGREIVFQREPKLRDAFLQVLFDHANTGGFSGAFTSGNRIETLRTTLRAAAQMALGTIAIDVLVTDIARQDV